MDQSVKGDVIERVAAVHARLVDVEDQLVGLQTGARSTSTDSVVAVVGDLCAVVRDIVDMIRDPLPPAPRSVEVSAATFGAPSEPT